MSLLNVRRALTRRWYVVLLGLLLTVGGAVMVARLVPAQHELTADVLLIPPKSEVAAAGENPYLNLNGLENMSGIVARAVTSTDAADQLLNAGHASDYTVEQDQTTPGPVLLVTVDDQSLQGAKDSLTAVLDLIPVQLRSLQEMVATPPKAFITSTVIKQDVVGKTVRTSQLRALVGTVGGGLAMTVLLAMGLDALLRSRRPDRADEQDAPVADAGPQSPVAGGRELPERTGAGQEGPAAVLAPAAWSTLPPQAPSSAPPLQEPASLRDRVWGPISGSIPLLRMPGWRPEPRHPVMHDQAADEAAQAATFAVVPEHRPGVNGLTGANGGTRNGNGNGNGVPVPAAARGLVPPPAPPVSPVPPVSQVPPAPAVPLVSPERLVSVDRPSAAAEPVRGSGKEAVPAAESATGTPDREPAAPAAPSAPSDPPTGSFERLVKGKAAEKRPDIDPRAAAHRLL